MTEQPEATEQQDDSGGDTPVAGGAISLEGEPSAAVPSTGDARVDAALGKLSGVDTLPLAAQVTVFDDVHRLLQDALSDTAPGPGGPSSR